MAFSIVWSPNALQDMEELYDFYAEKNLNAAARIHNQIIDEVTLLENNPMLGALEETLKHRVNKIIFAKVPKLWQRYDFQNNTNAKHKTHKHVHGSGC